MYVDRPGAKIYYQVTGSGERDVLLHPPCSPAAYSRLWKNNIPYLSRYFRIVAMDARGNGRSDRPTTGYDFATRYGDMVAVLDEATRPPIALVAFSCASMLAVRYAVDHPERVSHLVLVHAQYAQTLPKPFEEKVARVLRDDFDGWRTRLMTKCAPEPHSLKAIEDGIAWAGETTAEAVIAALAEIEKDNVFDLLAQVRTPTLILHGTEDWVVPYSHARKFAAAVPGARFVTFQGGGHMLPGREATKVNHLIRDFVLDRPVESHIIPPMAERKTPPRARRGSERRILWLSSPIGLGHIQRDIAIARRLRELYPDATVDFLAADPARRVVEVTGERLHPATDRLLNESAHIEGWAGDHELHGFNALWDMDEIMAANFMTFADVVERERYDLWVGDEGWDLDYYLHENPELKRAPYVFITDFIGVLPMRDDPRSTEFRRAWEKNAENIDHLRLHPDVRDLSVMVGDEEDVLDRPFGPDLPNMRQWAREHFRFSGYTYHFDPADYRDRARLRRELGYRDDERVILVSVGGTRAGRQLLLRCARAFELIAGEIPETRMILVAGPRLDPAEFPRHPRLDVRPFVPHLFRHHAAADLAIVQGGLTTTMELAAFRTPFLYVPLRNHWEQQFLVNGLGHTLRDVAVARELRALDPELEVHWLVQDPVTRVIEAAGETLHPASRFLAPECAHVESEAGEHDLHIFQTFRTMDEILLANFMVLNDVLEAEPYDLVVGDEAWEVDYYLHENPELKRTAFAWMADFVGWVPMDRDPGSREAYLTADYNAEMIEQVARFPRVRDRALFVGNPEDIVDLPFGPGLPKIRDWTEQHFSFPGYILPFQPSEFADREALRARLGFRRDEQVVFAAVGGTGVGHHLLRKVIAAWPETRRLVPGLRMIVVAGPRIDPASLPQAPGLEYRQFVPDLYAHLAASDLTVVQGGLSTCMELTATKRPFIFFPLRNHFEQNVHVAHRLARYGAGTRMDYHETTPEALAHAIADGLKRPVLYRDVETDGARRAAGMIAGLLR